MEKAGFVPAATRTAAWLAVFGLAVSAPGSGGEAQTPTRLIVVAEGLAPAVIAVQEEFRRDRPDVTVELKGEAAGGGAAELTDGRASLLVTMQPWTAAETAAFAARHGYEPLRVKVAAAELALHVYRDNPLETLSRRQVDAIYSRTVRCGALTPADRWRDLGVEAPVFATLPVEPYLQADLAAMVRARLLCGGDYRPGVVRMPSAASTVDAVRRDPNGIAIALRTQSAGVKTLRLEDGLGTAPAASAAQNPLRWDVYVYLNRPSLGDLPPHLRGFLRKLLGSAGRDAFRRSGLELPPAADTEDALQALEGC